MCDSQKCPDNYIILFTRFFKSPAATVDWLAHLAEKGWIEDNAYAFFEMMENFRTATGSRE